MASSDFMVLTNKGVISSAIVSAIIAGIGLIFFALFIWKRKDLDPPSYIDLEKASKPGEKGPTTEPGERSPELPIQHEDKTSHGSGENEDPFADFTPYAQYRESLAGRTRGHSRNGSNASSMTANDSTYSSYRETSQKRALLVTSVSSTDSTCRDSVSDYGSKDPGYTGRRSRGNSVESISSVYSNGSRFSQTSERIFINNVRLPPQFSTPTRPLSIVSKIHSVQCELVLLITQFIASQAKPSRPNRVSPPRPPRVGDSHALPF